MQLCPSTVNVTPVRDFAGLEEYHGLIVPGSKNTAASLRHLRETGLAAEVVRAAQRGTPVLGVCRGCRT